VAAAQRLREAGNGRHAGLLSKLGFDTGSLGSRLGGLALPAATLSLSSTPAEARWALRR
jgi:hypothetical protein